MWHTCDVQVFFIMHDVRGVRQMSRVCNTFILTHQYSYSFSHTNTPIHYHTQDISVRVRMILHKYSYLLAHTNTPIYCHTQILLFIITHKYICSFSRTITSSPYTYVWSHTNTAYMYSFSQMHILFHDHTQILHLLTCIHDLIQLLRTCIQSHTHYTNYTYVYSLSHTNTPSPCQVTISHKESISLSSHYTVTLPFCVQSIHWVLPLWSVIHQTRSTRSPCQVTIHVPWL